MLPSGLHPPALPKIPFVTTLAHHGGGITGILKVMGDFYLGHKVPFHFCIVIESIAKGFWRNPLLTLADAAAEEIGLGRRRDPAPVLRQSDQAFV